MRNKNGKHRKSAVCNRTQCITFLHSYAFFFVFNIFLRERTSCHYTQLNNEIEVRREPNVLLLYRDAINK